MNDHPPKSLTGQVVEFPNAEERARRLRVEVERLARLPTVEWMFYLDDIAAKYGVGSAKLKAMITAIIGAAEKKAKEDRGELRHREDRAEKQQDKVRREAEKKEDKARKEAEQKQRREE